MGKMTRGFLRCILLFTFATLVLASSYGEDDDVTDDTGMNHVARVEDTPTGVPEHAEGGNKEGSRTYENENRSRYPSRRKIGQLQKRRAHSFDE
uniref:Evasin n=1 Tax=Rhipicephalus appendiculatus TaxID=34631 RepID=A0A131YQM5_RHIAP